MSRIHVFADEAGNFDFTRNTGASAYFILATVTFFDDRQACHDLQSLRFDLAWAGTMHPGPFHATTDEQAVRNRVFAALAPHGFRIDATILEKSKARPEIRASHERFYQYAWYYHMKYLTPLIATPNDDLLVVAASIGERRKRDAYHAGVRDVMRQVGVGTVRATHWPAAADTGLQIADYCCWAIQRKWERRDARSHALIAWKGRLGVRRLPPRAGALLLTRGIEMGRLSLEGKSPGALFGRPVNHRHNRTFVRSLQCRLTLPGVQD